MAKQEEKVIYVRVAPELHAAIARIAEQERRSITSQAEIILEKYARENDGFLSSAKITDSPATEAEIAAVLQAFDAPGDDISQEEMELEIATTIANFK